MSQCTQVTINLKKKLKKCEPDGGAIQLSFPKQNENLMLSCCQIGKIPHSPSTVFRTPNQLL